MDDLLQLALGGTARQSGPVASHPTDELLAGVSADSPERRLLLQAGVRAIYTGAGRQAASAPEPPAACPPDHLPACSPRAAELLRTFLEHPRRELLEEALELLARSGHRLPPALLPRALDRCERVPPAKLVPVLGERGRWLCQFKQDWQRIITTASGDDRALPADADQIWSEGKLTERQAILEKARRIDPPRGRQWLAEVWEKEPADARNDLLSTLEAGLSEADVPFLESALADGSKKVRATASLLLCRFPGSDLTQRMRSLGETMLTFAAPQPEGKLKLFVKSLTGTRVDAGKLTVTPAKQFDKAWEKDGLLEKPPPGRGQREFWLTQVLERIPPTHWEKRFQATPAELIAAVAGDDSAESVLQAWSAAARGWHLEQWAIALCDAWQTQAIDAIKPNAPHPARQRLVELFPFIPREKAEELAYSLLSTPERIRTADDLGLLPRPWSKEFSQTYLKAFRERSQTVQAVSAFDFLQTAPVAAVALSPDCFAEAQNPWDIPDQPEMAYWKRAVESFLEVVQLRSDFLHAILPSGDSL
jgi:hypothetical protein